MAYFDYKERDLFYGRHLIGTVVFLAGIVNMLSPLFWESKNSVSTTILIGAGASLIGLFFMTTFDGKLIDFKGKRFKDYVSIFGYKRGVWQPLPTIRSVELLTTEEEAMNEPNGISPTITTRIKVHILCAYGDDKSEPTFILRIRNRKKAEKALNIFKSEMEKEVN